MKSRFESGTYFSDHFNCLLFFRPLCELRLSEWRSLFFHFFNKTIVTSRVIISFSAYLDTKLFSSEKLNGGGSQY